MKTRRWQSADGRLVLIRGDAYRHIPRDGRADACITDPCYGTTKLAWDNRVDAERFAALWKDATREAAVCATFAALPMAAHLIDAASGEFRYDLVWEKNNPTGHLDANRRPLRAHELILIFCRHRKGATYNPQRTNGHRPYPARAIVGTIPHYIRYTPRERRGSNDTRYPRSVLKIDRPRRAELAGHPTQKPLALIRWLVATFTNPDDLVIDPFAGSATTAVACHQLGRRFIGTEMDPDNYRAAVARLRVATRQPTGPAMQAAA